MIMNKQKLLTAAVVVGTGVLGHAAAEAASAADELGWLLAILGYSFRKFTINDCIDLTAALGLKHMSLTGSVNLDATHTVATVQLSDEQADVVRSRLASFESSLRALGAAGRE